MARASLFLAVILTALALVPVGAHLMSLDAKMAMPKEPYFVAQQAYNGWSWAGVVLFAAVFMNFTSAFVTRSCLGRSRLFSAAGLLMASTLAVFFTWTFPANEATGNWTSAPENWRHLRIQWEYSHAVNAALTFAALLCSAGGALLPDASFSRSRSKIGEGRPETQRSAA